MGFQIKDKEGNALSLQQLDEEAAAFWGKTLDLKAYANPFKPHPGMSELEIAMKDTTNWFDSIGWHIHNPQSNWTSGWANIKNSLWITCANGLDPFDVKFEVGVAGVKLYLLPYYQLIDHWKSKGYTPHKVGD